MKYVTRSRSVPFIVVLVLCAAAGWLNVTSTTQGGATTKPAADKEEVSDTKAKDKPALRFVVFGDSIVGHRPGISYQGHYLKFADLLQLMLEARYGIGRVEMINSGWGGDATYEKKGQGMPGGVKRLKQDLLDHNPDFAIIVMGGNDSQKTPEDRALTLKNLTTIAQRCREAKIKTLFVQYHPVMPAPENKAKAWWHLDDNNELIAKAAKAGGAEVIDMQGPMKAAAKKYPAVELVNPVDGVHLNPRGEMVYARALFERLDALGWIREMK